ncbi:glycosyltransferase family 2 protein, partial [Pseudophaeobacter sp.]
MRITAVTCVKNEGPFLLEWIAFNRLIGVTDFLFYSNDCTDGTAELLDALAARDMLTHLPNPA